MTWKVFDDRKYPYDGGDSRELVSEPRWVAGLDADGDGVHDLAVVSQDRLIIYLGRDAMDKDMTEQDAEQDATDRDGEENP